MGLGTLLLALALALGAAGFAQHDIWYAAAVAAGSGYWDLSSQPAHFRLRQSDNTRWQPTTPPPAEPSPIQKSRRRGGKGREPEAGPPQSSQLLEEPHGGPGPCPNLGRAQLDCDTAKESERQSEPARRRPAPESQLARPRKGVRPDIWATIADSVPVGPTHESAGQPNLHPSHRRDGRETTPDPTDTR